MKRLLLLLIFPVLSFGQVANDLIWSQRKSDNSGSIQRNVSPTANAALGVDAGKVPVALTAFTQDSATGAAGVTAAGSNQNITLTPSGTGVVSSTNSISSTSDASFRAWQGSSIVSNKPFFFNASTASAISAAVIGSGGPGFDIVGSVAGGTFSAPTATPQFQGLGWRLAVYDGTNWQESGRMSLFAGVNVTSTNLGTQWSVATAQSAETTIRDRLTINSNGTVRVEASSISIASWSNAAPRFRVLGGTITNTSTAGSGTAGSAVFSGFERPTLAASNSSVTTTDSSTVYIANSPANGSNMTITNPWSLWVDDGASRFDGPFVTPPASLTYASPTSVDTTLSSFYTVTTVNATGSVTFNATTGGKAGQRMTILITNDATSAKTITFGTNFVANGTLTPSGVNKVATIQFISNGTSFYEVSRTVLP